MRTGTSLSHYGLACDPLAPPAPLGTDWVVPPLTQEMSRDGTLEVDVFGAVAFVQLPPHEGMQVEVEGLQLVVELLQVILEGG